MDSWDLLKFLVSVKKVNQEYKDKYKRRRIIELYKPYIKHSNKLVMTYMYSNWKRSLRGKPLTNYENFQVTRWKLLHKLIKIKKLKLIIIVYNNARKSLSIRRFDIYFFSVKSITNFNTFILAHNYVSTFFRYAMLENDFSTKKLH